jgi:hypothetical protein
MKLAVAIVFTDLFKTHPKKMSQNLPTKKVEDG